MRNRWLTATAVFLMLVAVVSCGGTGSSSCGTTTTDVTVQYVYVANESAQSISGYELSSAGSLASVGNAVATGGSGPHDIVLDAANKRLFVLNRLSMNISVFTVNAQTGALTPVSGSPFAVGAPQVTAMALHPTGKFVFVTDSIGSLYAFKVDSGTGALTAVTGSPFASDVLQPGFVVVHPSGKFVYIASTPAPLTITGYTVDATNSTIQKMTAPFSAGAQTPGAMSIDPLGKYLFIATNEGTLTYFDIDANTGALTESTHSPLDIPSRMGVEMTVVNNFIYILDSNALYVDVYMIKPDGTVLAQGSQQMSSSITPAGIAVDSDGKYLMITDSAGSTIATYAIDSTTGGFTPIGSGVAAQSGAGQVASGKLTKQVTSSVACDGSSTDGGWH
jgi:6-phosphogluconolactonase